MINSDWYRYFLAAAETGSFTRGAEDLGITQSALSQGVKNLETDLGTALFLRRPRGIILTREGETLLGYVRESYRLLGLGEQEIRDRNKLEKGHIILGAGDTVCKHFLLPGIGSFHTRFPGIKISIMNRTSAELLALLEQRTIDIAVVTSKQASPPVPVRGSTMIELFTIQDCFACASSLIPSEGFKEDASPFLQEGVLLLPSPRTATRQNLTAYLESRDMHVSESIDFESVELQIAFAKMGMGTALAPRKSMEQELESGVLQEVPLPVPVPPRTVWGIYHSPPSMRIETFIKVIGSKEVLPNL